MKLPYSAGLKVVQTVLKLSKHIELIIIALVYWWLNTLETFEMHQIHVHVKVPYKYGLLVIPKDLKLSKHIKFM